MEKICIARRRRRELYPVSEETGEGCSSRVTVLPSPPVGTPGTEPDSAMRAVSIELTPDQSGLFQAGSGLAPGKAFMVSTEQSPEEDGRLVLNFFLAPVYGGRMLSPGEVSTMLRISKSLLAKLVRTHRIESYRIGRLRRFLLEDVLHYLSGSREHTKDTAPTGTEPRKDPDIQGE